MLFFFPIASSPICTAQACHFRDLSNEFAAVGAQRVGISTDTIDKQSHFAQQRSFDFPLLSDTDGTVAESFGVRRGKLVTLGRSIVARQSARRGRHTRRRGLLARLLPVRRTTFVIDTDRTVLKVVSSELRASVHADQALRFLQNRAVPQGSPQIREKNCKLDREPPRQELHAAPQMTFEGRVDREYPHRFRTQIRIIEGELFAQDGDLVVGTCDTFDTASPDILDHNSVRGTALDADLDAALQSVTPVDEAREGDRTVRYPLGTVAVVDRPSRKLFFVAYTTVSEDNTGHSTVDGLWAGLNALWDTVSERSRDSTVCVPVIGGGTSRLSSIVPTQEAIRLTILSFMFASRFNKVCDELRIVVDPQDYQRLDPLELQAFLTSFEPQ